MKGLLIHEHARYGSKLNPLTAKEAIMSEEQSKTLTRAVKGGIVEAIQGVGDVAGA